MARRKNKPEAVQEKNVLAERLRAIRVELFGERGGSEMARRLALPVRTWYNYESGVTVPAEIMLRFMELTSVEPMWLLHGKGPRYRPNPESQSSGGDSVRDLLRIALQRLEQREPAVDTSMLLSRSEFNPARRRATAAVAATVLTPAVAESHADAEPTQVPVPPFPESLVSGMTPAARQSYRCVRVDGDAMAPILADGAYVVYSEHEDPPQRLAGQLVVAWVDGQPRVRWFELSGRYGILRAENPLSEPQSLLIDLQGAHGPEYRLRRVVGTSTPH